ncbi:MAG TPA: FAD-binding oxidoreductase [Gaiellaceae bacterium]|jgi:FAD/FMN-containing dehydrogenase
MVDRYPALVVRPNDAADVAAAVRFARDQDLVVAVRSGGHSIPGFSTCDGGIVVDLSRMRGARVEGSTAHANGGALLAELDDAAQASGLVCPVGVVSHTGAAGLTLGGGMGRLQRKHGLTIDNLLAVELVTADARHVRASHDENADLFWGLRGAGANFGIATSFEFRLHPLASPITHGTVVHPIERSTELAGLFRELAEEGPDELWVSFGLGLDGREPVAALTALHCGSPEDAERDLAKVRAFAPPLSGSIEVKSYLETQHLNDEAMEWGHRFYMKSAFLPAFPDELVGPAAEALSTVPEGADGGLSVWACGRAIAEVPEAATAFAGRDAAYWPAVEIQWDDPALDDDCREWVRRAMEVIQPFASSGRYVNDVADPTDPRAIYGVEKYDRLVALKREWDPDNVFRLNQNVRP